MADPLSSISEALGSILSTAKNEKEESHQDGVLWLKTNCLPRRRREIKVYPCMFLASHQEMLSIILKFCHQEGHPERQSELGAENEHNPFEMTQFLLCDQQQKVHEYS